MNEGPALARVLEATAANRGDAIAILAPGRAPLTYRCLYDRVLTTGRALNAMGVGRDDRVAVVVPDTPGMLAASIAVAASTSCAPLNPAYRIGEFDYYLTSLGINALIIQSGLDSWARIAAERRGIPIIDLTLDWEEAGRITLSSGLENRCVKGGFAESGDIALLLHTSGTISRSNLVPLTHANICVSARTTAATLGLMAQDRCVNVMPLYHVHGLIGAALSTLVAGATLICPPAFNALDFFRWLEEFRPSWYTAVPTIHQAILSQAAGHSSSIRQHPLRFIRSCSAPLPSQIMRELERVFNAPVIEAYGMTEASHQICSNPLPPGVRKAGSVGVATGCEVAVVDEAGVALPPGDVGEIVIRGANVTAGYETTASDGRAALRCGWLRTGDQGALDRDGYLFIKGRLKDIINRGGIKISPREIEDILLEHHAVSQAVVFALPHATLGEDVAAAVVLRPGMAATEPELRQFTAQRLADFKVPCRIAAVDGIPRTPTGKVRRQDLADHFRPFLATPQDPREAP